MEEQAANSIGAGGILDGGNSDYSDSGSGRTGKRNRKEKGILELAILTDEDSNPAEKEDKKPKKKKKSSKGIGDISDNFKLMLLAVFGMIGERNPVWQVHESEIELITQPAARIFNRYVSDKTEEYSDIAMLLFGLIILTAPRIILSASAKKEVSANVHQKTTNDRSNGASAPKFADTIPGDGSFTF